MAATLFPNGEIFQNNIMYQKAWALKNMAWFNCLALSNLLPNMFLAKSLRSEQSRAASVPFAGLHYMLVSNIYLPLWFSFLIFFSLRGLHFYFSAPSPFPKESKVKKRILASQTNKKFTHGSRMDMQVRAKFKCEYSQILGHSWNNFSSPSLSTTVVHQREQQITETSVAWECLALTNQAEWVTHICSWESHSAAKRVWGTWEYWPPEKYSDMNAASWLHLE